MTRALSFAGCRTRAEATDRYRGYVEQLSADSVVGSGLDDDALAAFAEQAIEASDAAARQFREFLDREGIGKA